MWTKTLALELAPDRIRVCALAPVAAIDEAIHGHVTDLKLRKLVAAIEDGLSDGATR